MNANIEQAVILVKPDGLQRGLVGEIIGRFEKKGLKIVGLKMMTLADEVLDQWYAHHKEKAFLKRMFNDRKEEKDLTQQLQRCQELIATMEAMASEMQEAIDFSPNSIEEQKTLLKELRQRKKELQIQKREVAANMKAIRDDAHQQSVHAGQGILGYNSKTAAYQRRQIRYSKQAALGPQENAKAAIERQLLQTDRDILWAERFKE